MTISLRGSATGLAGGTTTALSFTLPTGHTTNDLLIAFAAWRAYTVTLSSGTFSTDYTFQAGGANGTTANGLDAGSTYATIRTRVHDGSEANPTGTLSAAPSPRMSGMLALQSTVSGSGWDLAATEAEDTTSGTAGSWVGGSLNFAVGDWLVILVAHNSDAKTHTSPAISASGITFSTLTQRLGTTTTTSGNDGSMYLYTCSVTAGSGTVAPTFSTSNNLDGQAVFLRVREPAAPATQTLIASGISASPTLGSVALSPKATVVATAFTDTSNFDPVALVPAATVQAASVVGTPTVPHPAVSQTIPPQVLQAASITNTASVGTPYLNKQQVIDITNRSVFPLGPAGTPDQTLVATPIENTATFAHGITLTPTVSLTATAITDTVTFGTPTVSGAVTVTAVPIDITPSFAHNIFLIPTASLQASGITASPTVGTPSVSLGAATLVATAIASTATVGTPTVSQAGAAVTLIPTPITSTAAVGSVALQASATVAVQGVTASPTVGSVALSASATLVVDQIASTVAVGTPALFLQSGQTLSVGEILSPASVADVAMSASVSLSTVGVTAVPAVQAPALSQVLRRVTNVTSEQVYTTVLPFARYGIDTGMTVILKDGQVTVMDYPDTLTLDEADAYYLGGHSYALSESAAQALIDAGRPDLVEIL